MPRSGSELLQVLLHQNPDIYGSTTSPLLEFQYAARSNYELPEVQSQNPELMREAFLEMCGGMADSYYAPITKRDHIVDKNRGWLHYYEWVSQWQPEPKMVCMVRDLRGILDSFERVFRANRHRPIGPDDPAKIQNMTVEQRVHYWLNTQPVGLALQRLKDCYERKIDDKILFLRFEDLLEKPQDTLDVWYEFVGVPTHQHTFDTITKTVQENDRLFGPYGSHAIKPTLEPLHDWSETYERKVCELIYESVPWYFEAFNYKRRP
jgi:sulfotransferase